MRNYPPYLIRVRHNEGNDTRFTKGRIYPVKFDSGKIYDDNGKLSRPCWEFEGFNKYWKIPEDWSIPTEKITDPICSNHKTKEKETIMTIVKNATLINGQDADDMPTDQLINLIKEQEHKIESLNKIRTPSKKITKIIAEHEAVIKSLVKVLDKK